MSALDTQVGGSHYRNGSIQPVQYIEANKLGYLEGVVVKRVTRHNQPGGKGRQDIEKAIHELQLLLELRYPDKVALNIGAADPRCKDCGVVHVGPCHRSVGCCMVCGRPGGHGGLPCPSTMAVSNGGDLAHDGHD